MSSHHIVREKQEPALLIAGLKAFSDELLGQLLEWSPTVIVTADTAEQVQTMGIKIDWLVADEIVDLQQSDIKLIVPVGEPPVNAALQYLADGGYHAVNLITDEPDIAGYGEFVEQLDLVIFSDNKRIMAVRSVFSKWKPAGERIEFLTPPNNFVYTNLFAVADNVFEIIHDGFFTLQFSDPYIWIAEQL